MIDRSFQFFANDAGFYDLQYAVDLTCQFNPYNRKDAKKCKRVIDDVSEIALFETELKQ